MLPEVKAIAAMAFGSGLSERAKFAWRASLNHVFKGSTAPKPSRPHGHKCSNRLFRPAE